MINSKELRIGNLVSFQGEEIEVNSIFENGIHDKMFNGIGYDFLNPIPLTEEWLLRLGFKDNELNAVHNLFVWYENHIGIKGMLGVVKPCKCIYVHQLQNLYFALTNNELTLK